MGKIVVGTEAVAQGDITRHELARWYRPFFPGVHAPRGYELTTHDRATGAWLWSDRRAIVTGVAASAIHGAEWVDANTAVELVYKHTHACPPAGIISRNERIASDEITCVGGIPVSTVARTAFDIGRYQARGRAIARLDALMRAAPFSAEEVLMLATRYRGARGVRLLKDALPLVDGGAASPRESWLRLVYIDAGLPKPTTQIPIYDTDGTLLRTVDMGWEDYKVLAEYDGDQHQSDRGQYVKDRRVIPRIEALGYIVLRVIKEDRKPAIIRDAWDAMASRGWRP
ncbi:MAG TPA: hypothetical protein VJR50_05660 [Mycobacterium sp.]|nr:hypothetical protein [Mycobacterium sp.]